MHTIVTQTVLIAIGGAAGANARFWLGSWVAHKVGNESFPWGTLSVNLIGAFVAGLVSQMLERHNAASAWRYLLIVGFLGGFTTFSAFALESLGLTFQRHWGSALGYFLGSPLAGLFAVAAGYGVGRLVGGGFKA